MTKENPTVEEPTVEEPTPKDESPEQQAKELLATLEKLGVDNPEKLEGMATASQQAGRYAHILGEKNSEINELKTMIQNLSEQRSTPQTNDEYGEPTVDLGALIDQKLDSFWDRKSKEQAKAEASYYSELAEVQNDPDYGMVSDIWDKHISNPNTVAAIRSGRTTMTKEYDKLVRTYQRELLKQSTDTLKGLTERGVQPPHVESGDTQSIPLPTEDEEKKKKIKNITSRENWRGTDDDIANLVKTVLPPDDPIFT